MCVFLTRRVLTTWFLVSCVVTLQGVKEGGKILKTQQTRGVRTGPPTTDADQRDEGAVRGPVCAISAFFYPHLAFKNTHTHHYRSRPPRAVGEGPSRGYAWVWVHPYGWQWMPLDKIEQGRKMLQAQKGPPAAQFDEEERPNHPSDKETPAAAPAAAPAK